MTLDGYALFAVVERGLALLLCLLQTQRARTHESEATFDYRRRAVFAYALNALLVGTLFVSGIAVLLPQLDSTVSRVAITLGITSTIVGYGLLLLGWPGVRRKA